MFNVQWVVDQIVLLNSKKTVLLTNSNSSGQGFMTVTIIIIMSPVCFPECMQHAITLYFLSPDLDISTQHYKLQSIVLTLTVKALQLK